MYTIEYKNNKINTNDTIKLNYLRVKAEYELRKNVVSKRTQSSTT